MLLIIVGFAGRWVLGAAFRPVSRMTAEAEAWSTEDLDRRFEMGEPHDELTQLAHTLDGMLDRLAASLRREQRFSAEVSHQLRTPVAKIKAEAELALRRPRDPEYYQEALGSVLYSADQMARTVEALLAAAQEEGSLARGRADVWQVLADVVSSIGVLAEENGVEVSVQPPARDLRVGVERAIAAQILQPVVENACRFAQAEVLLGAGRNGKEVYFWWRMTGRAWPRRRGSGSSSPACAVPRRPASATAPGGPGWASRWPAAWRGPPPGTWRSRPARGRGPLQGEAARAVGRAGSR